MAQVKVEWIPAENDNATAYRVDVAKAVDPSVAIFTQVVSASDPYVVTFEPIEAGDWIATVTPINPALVAIVGTSTEFSILEPVKPVLVHPIQVTATVESESA